MSTPQELLDAVQLKATVLYHGGCNDGVTAAAVAACHLLKGESEPRAWGHTPWNAGRGPGFVLKGHDGWTEGDAVLFLPCDYNRVTPEMLASVTRAGSELVLVDFSLPVEVLKASLADSSLTIDHHVSALRSHYAAWYGGPTAAAPVSAVTEVRGRDTFVYDADRSGAGLAWRHFFPNSPCPQLILDVEDRDLWRFKRSDSRAVKLALDVFLGDPEPKHQWAKFIELVQELHPSGGSFSRQKDILYHDLVARGQPMLDFYESQLHTLAGDGAVEIEIGGERGRGIGVSYMFASELGSLLAAGEGCRFAATWCQDSEGTWHVSLRSAGSGADVAAMAEALGGGGHKHAAGFKMNRNPFDAFRVQPGDL